MNLTPLLIGRWQPRQLLTEWTLGLAAICRSKARRNVSCHFWMLCPATKKSGSRATVSCAGSSFLKWQRKRVKYYNWMNMCLLNVNACAFGTLYHHYKHLSEWQHRFYSHVHSSWQFSTNLLFKFSATIEILNGQYRWQECQVWFELPTIALQFGQQKHESWLNWKFNNQLQYQWAWFAPPIINLTDNNGLICGSLLKFYDVWCLDGFSTFLIQFKKGIYLCISNFPIQPSDDKQWPSTLRVKRNKWISHKERPDRKQLVWEKLNQCTDWLCVIKHLNPHTNATLGEKRKAVWGTGHAFSLSVACRLPCLRRHRLSLV